MGPGSPSELNGLVVVVEHMPGVDGKARVGKRGQTNFDPEAGYRRRAVGPYPEPPANGPARLGQPWPPSN